MSAEANKPVVRRFFEEVWSEGNRDTIRDLVHNDWLPSDPALRHIRPRSGTSGIATFMTVYRGAFPDLTFVIEEQVAEGDVVVTRFEARGTHSGEEVTVSFLGHRNFTIAPTGSLLTARGVSINRIVTSERDGSVVRKITSNTWYWQTFGLLEALAVAQMRRQADTP